MDARNLSSPRVVRNIQNRSHLYHDETPIIDDPGSGASIHSVGTGQYLFDSPSLARAQRTGFDNANPISNFAGPVLVVSQKLRGLPLYFLVETVLHQSVDGNRDRFLHSRAGYGADLALADSSFLFSSHVFLNSRFEILLFAFHFFQNGGNPGNVAADIAHLRGAFQLTRGGLETEPEELLAQFGFLQKEIFL